VSRKVRNLNSRFPVNVYPCRLTPTCSQQRNETRRLLCDCAKDEIGTSKSDDLRDQFLTCTKVDADQRSSMALIDANPHREYAISSFCHIRLDPCNWLWRKFVDEAASEEEVKSIIDHLTDPIVQHASHGPGVGERF
jgi:hypothetical protein